MIKHKKGKVVKSQNKLSKLMKRETKDKKYREELQGYQGQIPENQRQRENARSSQRKKDL